MATKTTKKTAKMVEEVKEVLPDAADAVALAAEAKEGPSLVVAKKTPDEEFEAEYGKVMRDRDQTGLLSAILKELFLLRISRG